MCYTVIVAGEKCPRDHPKPEHAYLCLRQCAKQAGISSTTAKWAQHCGIVDHEARVLITDTAEITVSKSDCSVCVAHEDDEEIIELWEDTAYQKQQYKSTRQTQIDILGDLEKEKKKKDNEAKIDLLKGFLQGAGRGIEKVEKSIETLKAKVLIRQHAIELEGEDVAAESAETQHDPSYGLPYFMNAEISIEESFARRHRMDCPLQYPTEEDAAYHAMDALGILWPESVSARIKRTDRYTEEEEQDSEEEEGDLEAEERDSEDEDRDSEEEQGGPFYLEKYL